MIQLSGLLDPVNIDFLRASIETATKANVQVLVLQLDSTGGAKGQAVLDELSAGIANSKDRVPIAVWVGQTGAKAQGAAYRLLQAADIVGTSTRTDVGKAPAPTTAFPTDPLAGASVSGEKAIDLLEASGKTVVRNTPTIGDFIVSLDGVEALGRTLHTSVVKQTDKGPRRQPIGQVAFAKLTLTGRLMHTAASPAVAFFLLVLGFLLVVFEFYTAGVGVAGVVGMVCLILSCYGLAVLPTRPIGVGFVALGILGFAIDVQAGSPRFWTAIGTASLVAGSFTIFAQHDVGIVTSGLVIVGAVLFMVAGMPSMVRARFSTPTIGRERMIGEVGTALELVSPEGKVEVRGAQWLARTNRATPIAAGAGVRVVAVDGLLLEVEPEAGGAKDYREQAKARHAKADPDMDL